MPRSFLITNRRYKADELQRQENGIIKEPLSLDGYPLTMMTGSLPSGGPSPDYLSSGFTLPVDLLPGKSVLHQFAALAERRLDLASYFAATLPCPPPPCSELRERLRCDLGELVDQAWEKLSVGDESHGCPECGKQYSTSSNLARHRQTHRSVTDKKARKCPHCEKVYVSMPAYSMHVRTHNQGCECAYCGKRFSRPWLLQGHIRTHTGEKPFKCPECSKAFADKSNLRAHVQTHSSEKPYACGRCGKAFALKSYLYKHEESSCMRGQRYSPVTQGQNMSPSHQGPDQSPTAQGHVPVSQSHSPIRQGTSPGHSPVINAQSPVSQGHSSVSKGLSPIAQGHSPIAQGHSQTAQIHSPIAQANLVQGHSPIAQGHPTISQGHSLIAQGHSTFSQGHSPVRSPVTHEQLQPPMPSGYPSLLQGFAQARPQGGAMLVAAS